MKEEVEEEEENITSKILSYYLIWSVIVSFVIILFGTLEFLSTGSSGYIKVPLDVLIRTGGEATQVFPHYLGTILYGIIKLKSFAIIQFGILILILSPIARIFLQFVIYTREKDKNFTIIAVTVFLILLLSLYLSKFVP